MMYVVLGRCLKSFISFGKCPREISLYGHLIISRTWEYMFAMATQRQILLNKILYGKNGAKDLCGLT